MLRGCSVVGVITSLFIRLVFIYYFILSLGVVCGWGEGVGKGCIPSSDDVQGREDYGGDRRGRDANTEREERVCRVRDISKTRIREREDRGEERPSPRFERAEEDVINEGGVLACPSTPFPVSAPSHPGLLHCR